MTNKIDMTGAVVGRLTVIEEVGSNSQGSVMWRCLCECGSETTVVGASLRSEITKSCGCIQRKAYGMRRTRFYGIWSNMRARCNNPNHMYYHNYGGRGVEVCERWNDFTNFYDDMYERYIEHVEVNGEKNTSIDRVNSNGNYEPDNCKWATRVEQVRNRRVFKGSKSGRVGVTLHKDSGKWRSIIRVDGKNLHLGLFSDIQEAIRAREEAEKKYWGVG